MTDQISFLATPCYMMPDTFLLDLFLKIVGALLPPVLGFMAGRRLGAPTAPPKSKRRHKR